MPTRGSKDPNGRALRGRRAHTTFISDPIAQIWSNYNVRSGADGAATPEQPAVQNCLYDRFEALYKKSSIKPSLVIVPARFKSGTLYSEIPTANGDFTVTRASGGVTRVNASGLIESAKTNLALQSTFVTGWSTSFSGSVSANASGTNSPDGTANAALLNVTTSGFSGIYRTITTVSGSTYTASVFAKKRDKNFLYFVNLAGTTAIAWFNLASGTVGTVGANTTARIENYGNDWYRCSITQTVSGVSSYIQFGLSDADNTNAAASSGSNFVFGAQFEEGSSASEYIPTTTVARTRFAGVTVDGTSPSGIPRLDYFASGGVVGCPALLVEPSGSNGILNSTDTTTNWLLGANLTSGAIDVIGVSGNNITVAVSGSNIGSAAGCHQRQSNSITLTSGSTYTISFLMKKTGAHTIGGFFANTSGATNTAFGSGFDVSGSFSSGSLIQSSPITNRIRRVEQWGADVYRCSETFTMTATNILTTFRLGPIVSVTDLTNPAIGSQLGFAAPQLELGSVPTSFIPTTTGSVTRNADVISVSGAVSGSIGQTEGTLYAEVDYRNFATVDANIAQLFLDGNNRFGIGTYRDGANNRFQGYALFTGSVVVNINTIIASAGIYKLALAYKLNDYVLYINGTQIGADTSAGVPTANAVHLGHGNSSFQFNNRIRAAALYTERLTNDQLAFITQP